MNKKGGGGGAGGGRSGQSVVIKVTGCTKPLVASAPNSASLTLQSVPDTDL